MIALATLNAAPDEEFVIAFGGIYEHSDWVARRIVVQRPFQNLESLRVTMHEEVEKAPKTTQLKLICAHPDLAGKLAREGNITETSAREQAGLGLDRLSGEEYETFSELNLRYREKFGFPFIICARLTTQRGLLDAFETRLKNSREAEIFEALEQVHEIARLRLQDLVIA